MNNRQHSKSDILPALVGLLLAALTVLFVKFVLLPSVMGTGAKEQILSLEIAIILVILGAFVLKEILEALVVLVDVSRRRRKVHVQLDYKAVVLLVGAFAASVLIYFYVYRYFATAP